MRVFRTLSVCAKSGWQCVVARWCGGVWALEERRGPTALSVVEHKQQRAKTPRDALQRLLKTLQSDVEAVLVGRDEKRGTLSGDHEENVVHVAEGLPSVE